MNRVFRMKKSLNVFYSNYTSKELHGFATKLIDTIDQNPELHILRGKIAVWTAAVVVVIARMNFLFYKSSENHMSIDDICDYFGTNKFTIINKASLIQNTCGISMFDSRFTQADISGMPDLSVTEEGFIIPASGSSISVRSIEVAKDDDLADIDFFEEKLRCEKEHDSKRYGARKRKPKKQKPTDQLNLFDDE